MSARDYRYESIERHLESLEKTLSAIGPSVGQVAALSADMSSAQEDIREIKADLQSLESGTASRLRELEAGVKSSPIETLKLMLIVVTVFASVTGAIIALVGVFS